MKRVQIALAVAAFLFLAVAANVLTTRFGLVSVGFGLMATAGTWAAGLVLLARDVVHDLAGRLAVVACIAVGAALSAWLTIPQLAVASGVAFAVSELLDLAVYQPLRKRGWARAVIASNAVGAVVDTVVFLWLAGFGLTWAALGGQMVAKMTATLAVVLLVKAVAGALLRDRVRPEGA